MRFTFASLALGVLIAGCNDPAPVTASHRSSVVITDRGISIPLPPPSVLEAPQQEVEVDGEIDGDVGEGAEVRIVDTRGGDEASVPATDGRFTATLQVDLTAACIETWVIDADGFAGQPRRYSTHVEPDDSIRVEPECD